ncbi:MAG TPA: SPOR domain-containing protein [Xanthobacteraceae bacterium]|nr:SPOR domain-containing protein [Xanthobacteraceae bacterium]
MSEDNTENRLSNAPVRGKAPSEQTTDPLAELARLIGQNDPFIEFGRDNRAQAQPPQRTVPNGPQLTGNPFPDLREPMVTNGAHNVEQQPPAFIQANRDDGSYRDSMFRNGHHGSDVDFYDDAETGGGRRATKILVVIALAVVGSAGAFAYKFMFSGPSSNAPPPIIRANTEPTKVPPPVASADTSSNKLTYDRVGDRSQDERVVPREESPVDPRDLTRPSASRNAASTATSPSNQLAQTGVPVSPPSAAASNPASAATLMTTEPKKVRTVPIRPEMNESAMAPPSLTPPGAATPAAVAPTPRPAAPAASTATAAAPASAPMPSPRAAVAAPQSPQPAQRPANAPLVLNDDSSPTLPRLNAPAPAQPRPAPQAAPRPAPMPLAAATPKPAGAPAAAPAPKPAATTSGGAGGYLVQVSSQRNEADAQAALRTAQTKYPNVLGGQKVTIRRADLGERGTFYRAMIGPFASREQATQLCGSLKAAGGDCIVQAN